MIRKLVGFASMMALALAFAGCGSSSTNSEEDECTKDPESVNCKVEAPDDVLTDGVEP
jgi:predicted component of type VI protein secretion system